MRTDFLALMIWSLVGCSGANLGAGGRPACSPKLGDDGCLRIGAQGTGVCLEQEEEEAQMTVKVYPRSSQTVLAAIEGEVSGYDPVPESPVLWEVDCRPRHSAIEFAREEGASFQFGALSPDGRVLFYTGARGVMALHLDNGAVERVTSPPLLTSEGCWGATDEEDDFARDVVTGISPDGMRLFFQRGGPCGFESDWISTPMVLLHPLEPGLRAEHQPHPVTEVLVDAGGTIWLADGGRCSEPGPVDLMTSGAIWRSDDGGDHWVIVSVDPADATPMIGPPERIFGDSKRPGHVLILESICGTSGGTMGGSVFTTTDSGKTWSSPVLPESLWDRGGVDEGQGIEKVVVVEGNTDRFLMRLRYDSNWVSTQDGGATFSGAVKEPEASGAPSLRACTKGCCFVATADGLMRTCGDSKGAIRVFPNASTDGPAPSPVEGSSAPLPQ